MSKYIVTVFAALLSCTPAISLAQGVGQINGNGNASQKLSTTTGVTTMHMQIVTQQGEHTFQWDSTPWRVDQGGTGQTTFTSGALLYGNGTSPIGSVAPGNLGDILQFNGTFPTWVSASSLGIVAQPAGSDGQIQFNDDGVFGGTSGFTYNGELNIDFNINMGPNAGDTIYFLNPFGGRGSYIGVDWSDGGADSGPIISSHSSSTVLMLEAQDVIGVARLRLPLLTQDRYFSFPNASGTFGLLEADQKWMGTNTFSKGTAATTTVNFGEMGDSTSHVCFNTKNSAGQDMSFYFNNDFEMVVEHNPCQ